MASTQRCWDGTHWTAHVAPAAAPVAAQDYGPQTVEHWLVPVGRSGPAIAAGYVGIVAIVFAALGIVGMVVGATAVGLGVWALKLVKQGKHGSGRAIFAIVAGMFGIVVGALTIQWYA